MKDGSLEEREPRKNKKTEHTGSGSSTLTTSELFGCR
jgi:hypothetical protein